MDLTNLIIHLHRECSNLNLTQQVVIKNVELSKIDEKVKNIINKSGCEIEIKNGKSLVLVKKRAYVAIFEPNDEVIRTIHDVKKSLKERLEYLLKITKSNSLKGSTAKLLREFLDKIDSNVKEIVKLKGDIEKSMKEDTTGYA